MKAPVNSNLLQPLVEFGKLEGIDSIQSLPEDTIKVWSYANETGNCAPFNFWARRWSMIFSAYERTRKGPSIANQIPLYGLQNPFVPTSMERSDF